MRITNSLVSELAISDFAKDRAGIDAANRKVATGHRFEAASEDPAAAAGVMRNNEQLRALTQYRQNVSAATARSSLEEGALDQLTSLLTRAKELAVAQATGTSSSSTRAAAGAEVNQLLAQAVQLSNTKNGDEYLFGGLTSTTAPFGIDITTSPYTFSVAAVAPAGARQIEVGSGQFATASHDGTQVFGTTTAGVLKAMQDLATALQAGTAPAVTAVIDSLDIALANTQRVFAESGARASQLTITESNLAALSNQLTSFNADLQDADMASAITELSGRQLSYQAALAATSKIMNLSLADYIR